MWERDTQIHFKSVTLDIDVRRSFNDQREVRRERQNRNVGKQSTQIVHTVKRVEPRNQFFSRVVFSMQCHEKALLISKSSG